MARFVEVRAASLPVRVNPKVGETFRRKGEAFAWP
jgi:hypothetical protein